MPSFDRKIISDYVVVDIETTGLSPENDRIIEIAAVKVSGDKVIDRFSTLVDPERHIDSYITNITGISDRMVKGAPKIYEVMPRFIEFVGDMPILGHNVIRFDMRFLERAGSPVPYCVDTLDIANHLHINSEGKSLTALCAYFNVTNDNAHRALSDCLATHGVYQKMKEHYRREGAYFTMAVSCARKLYQENIGRLCRVGDILTAEPDSKGQLVFTVQGNPVGTASGNKLTELTENKYLVREIKISSLKTNDKGKFLMSAEVILGEGAECYER